MHGGLSTGAKTAEGRQRQREGFARYLADRRAGTWVKKPTPPREKPETRRLLRRRFMTPEAIERRRRDPRFSRLWINEESDFNSLSIASWLSA